jgi:hypothetical protein
VVTFCVMSCFTVCRVPAGISILRWCTMEMKLLRHLSCDRLKLKLKHSLWQKSRILFNVVLNLMKAVKIQFLPLLMLHPPSSNSKLTKMLHRLHRSVIVWELRNIQTIDSQTEISVWFSTQCEILDCNERSTVLFPFHNAKCSMQNNPLPAQYNSRNVETEGRSLMKGCEAAKLSSGH